MAVRNSTRRPVVFASFAVAVVVASGCVRFGSGVSPTEQVDASPSEAGTEAPLPVPEGVTLLAVLDPEVVNPKVSAVEAVALARASMGNRVGASPSVQLVRLAFQNPDSDFRPIWTGWTIFSTDVPGSFSSGPYAYPSPKPLLATFTWVYVSADGEVMGATREGYETAESVPTLPPE